MATGSGGVGYSASSSASSAAKSNAAFDNSGWSLNYGTQQTVPSWVWAAGLALGAAWLLLTIKRGR